MKGNNEIRLNVATMAEAVEFWLKEKILRFQKFEVTNITQSNAPSANQFQFIIDIRELGVDINGDHKSK